MSYQQKQKLDPARFRVVAGTLACPPIKDRHSERRKNPRMPVAEIMLSSFLAGTPRGKRVGEGAVGSRVRGSFASLRMTLLLKFREGTEVNAIGPIVC